MAQLCQEIDKLQDLNTKVIIISFGTFPSVQAWLKETCTSFQVLLDPEREVYRAYGLERSFFRSWGLKTIMRYVRLLVAGRKWRGIQGDSTQLGGDFIIDKYGLIQLVYCSHDPTDRPAVDEMMKLLKGLE